MTTTEQLQNKQPVAPGGPGWGTPVLVGLLLCLGLLFLGGPATAPLAAQPVENTIRIGVSAMITPVSAVRYYQEIVDYVAERLGVEGEMVHRTTYDEMDRMLEDMSVDVAFICSAPYVLNHEKFGVELLVGPQVNGETVYHSHIIVHRDSPINSLEELQKHTFAFVDPKSNSGRLYPIFRLAEKNHTPDSFFSRYFFSYSHNKSVEMVAKKKVDGAAVDSLVLRHMLTNNSPYAHQVKVIHSSPPFGIPPVVVPLGLPIYLKEKIREIFLRMHEDPRGREILNAMDIDRFVVVNNASYDSIREMKRFVEENRPAIIPVTDQVEKGQGASTVVKFSVVPSENPRIAYEKYQPLLDYLEKRTGLTFELSLKKNHPEIVKGMGNSEFYLALLGPLSYLDAHMRYGAVPIAKSKTSSGSPFSHSVIVVGPESDIQEVRQLAGRKFAFTSLWSTVGNLFPRYMLAWEDIHLESLGAYHNFDYHDTVIKKVMIGEYDAGAVRQAVAEKYAPFGLRTIAVSDPIPTSPVVISPQAPYLVVRAVQQALLDMASDPEGRQVLALLDPELQGGFIPASDTDYSGVRKMINDVPDTCGRGCHPKVHF